MYFENFPEENAGYQYRAKKWSDILNKRGFYSKVKTTVKDKEKFEVLVNHRFSFYLIKTLIIKFIQVITSFRYETVIVRRNIILYNEYGNLFMEKLLHSIHLSPILDIDDDMRLLNYRPSKNLFGIILFENRDKFYQSILVYKRFIVASTYLQQLILSKNKSVIPENIKVIPTCVDYLKYPQKEYRQEKEVLNLGWIGSNENQKYIDSIINQINFVSKKYKIKLIIISGKEYQNKSAEFEICNISWSLETEIKDLLKIDIGLMPLPNTNLTKGKGGFKIIQYMGLGIVSLAKAITINNDIIDNSINGFLYNDDKDFQDTLLDILNRQEDYYEIGTLARKKINDYYSFSANTPKLTNLLCKN